MSQLKITNAGLAYKDLVFSGAETQNITHFIFANIAGLNEGDAIDPNMAIPTNAIVHSQPIQRVSALDGNAVVLSAVLDYTIGDFEFNWFGAVATKADNSQVLIAVVQTALQTKTKTVGPSVGNYSVKSIVWRSQNIADNLNVTLSALPWQLNDTAFASKAEFNAHNHDNDYAAKNSVLTNVPLNALFTDTNTQRAIHDAPVNGATTISISSNWAFDNVKTAVPENAKFTDTNTQRAIHDSPVNGATTISISSNWAFDNVKTAVPTGAKFTDTNTHRAIHNSPIDGATTTSISSNWAFDNVKTAVPINAKFTDTNTWRSISDSLASTSNSVSASSKAVKSLQDNKLEKTAKAADSQKLDNLDSSQFLRSDANDNLTAALIVPDANRNQGVFGTYKSGKTQHIWSMGTSYRNAANGADYGNLYGAAYSYNSVGDGQAKAGSHQFVWCHNGVAKCALGSNLWTSGFVYEQNQLLSARYLGKTATAANASKVANLTVKQVIKKSIDTHYSTGNITISLGDAIEHRVMRWGSGNGTITITGTPTKGDKILIDNIRDSSGKATITGKTMYTPDGANASTHMLTGKGQVEFTCYDGVRFMMTRAVG